MRLGALASSLVPWLAIAASGCGPGPLPKFPPHAPAPELSLSIPAIEDRFRADGTANVKVEPGAPYATVGGDIVDTLAITLSPTPPALVDAAFRFHVEDYIARYRDVLALRPFSIVGPTLDPQRRLVFEESSPPIAAGCKKITVVVDFTVADTPSVAHIVRTCTRRRVAPNYSSRRLPAMPSDASGVVLECALTGGGAAFVYHGLSIDDYGDVYKSGFPGEAVDDYVRTIRPEEMEEAIGLAVLAIREPEIVRTVEPPSLEESTAHYGTGCSAMLAGNTVPLGSPDRPARRGPATRRLLRWLDAHGIVHQE